jgi:hypothetical protein
MSEIQVNTINEYTGANGVTIDGVLVKDSVAHSGLVKLASTTASDDATLTFDNFVDSSTYSSYRIDFENIKAGTDNVILRATFRQGGGSGSDITGTYRHSEFYGSWNSSSEGTTTNQTNTDFVEIMNSQGTASGEENSGYIDFFPAYDTKGKSYVKVNVAKTNNSTNVFASILYGGIISTTVCTGIKFFMSSGNIASGTITIFGVKK